MRLTLLVIVAWVAVAFLVGFITASLLPHVQLNRANRRLTEVQLRAASHARTALRAASEPTERDPRPVDPVGGTAQLRTDLTLRIRANRVTDRTIAELAADLFACHEAQVAHDEQLRALAAELESLRTAQQVANDNASELHADRRRSGFAHSIENLVELAGVELELDSMTVESQATSTRLRHLAGQHLALTAGHRTTSDIYAVIDLELSRVARPTSR